MESTLKENVKRRATWMRLLYILMFAVIYQVAEIVLAAVVVSSSFSRSSPDAPMSACSSSARD